MNSSLLNNTLQSEQFEKSVWNFRIFTISPKSISLNVKATLICIAVDKRHVQVAITPVSQQKAKVWVLIGSIFISTIANVFIEI